MIPRNNGDSSRMHNPSGGSQIDRMGSVVNSRLDAFSRSKMYDMRGMDHVKHLQVRMDEAILQMKHRYSDDLVMSLKDAFVTQMELTEFASTKDIQKMEFDKAALHVIIVNEKLVDWLEQFVEAEKANAPDKTILAFGLVSETFYNKKTAANKNNKKISPVQLYSDTDAAYPALLKETVEGKLMVKLKAEGELSKAAAVNQKFANKKRKHQTVHYYYERKRQQQLKQLYKKYVSKTAASWLSIHPYESFQDIVASIKTRNKQNQREFQNLQKSASFVTQQEFDKASQRSISPSYNGQGSFFGSEVNVSIVNGIIANLNDITAKIGKNEHNIIICGKSNTSLGLFRQFVKSQKYKTWQLVEIDEVSQGFFKQLEGMLRNEVEQVDAYEQQKYEQMVKASCLNILARNTDLLTQRLFEQQRNVYCNMELAIYTNENQFGLLLHKGVQSMEEFTIAVVPCNQYNEQQFDPVYRRVIQKFSQKYNNTDHLDNFKFIPTSETRQESAIPSMQALQNNDPNFLPGQDFTLELEQLMRDRDRFFHPLEGLKGNKVYLLVRQDKQHLIEGIRSLVTKRSRLVLATYIDSSYLSRQIKVIQAKDSAIVITDDDCLREAQYAVREFDEASIINVTNRKVQGNDVKVMMHGPLETIHNLVRQIPQPDQHLQDQQYDQNFGDNNDQPLSLERQNRLMPKEIEVRTGNKITIRLPGNLEDQQSRKMEIRLKKHFDQDVRIEYYLEPSDIRLTNKLEEPLMFVVLTDENKQDLEYMKKIAIEERKQLRHQFLLHTRKPRQYQNLVQQYQYDRFKFISNSWEKIEDYITKIDYRQHIKKDRFDSIDSDGLIHVFRDSSRLEDTDFTDRIRQIARDQNLSATDLIVHHDINSFEEVLATYPNYHNYYIITSEGKSKDNDESRMDYSFGRQITKDDAFKLISNTKEAASKLLKKAGRKPQSQTNKGPDQTATVRVEDSPKIPNGKSRIDVNGKSKIDIKNDPNEASEEPILQVLKNTLQGSGNTNGPPRMDLVESIYDNCDKVKVLHVVPKSINVVGKEAHLQKSSVPQVADWVANTTVKSLNHPRQVPLVITGKSTFEWVYFIQKLEKDTGVIKHASCSNSVSLVDAIRTYRQQSPNEPVWIMVKSSKEIKDYQKILKSNQIQNIQFVQHSDPSREDANANDPNLSFLQIAAKVKGNVVFNHQNQREVECFLANYGKRSCKTIAPQRLLHKKRKIVLGFIDKSNKVNKKCEQVQKWCKDLNAEVETFPDLKEAADYARKNPQSQVYCLSSMKVSPQTAGAFPMDCDNLKHIVVDGTYPRRDTQSKVYPSPQLSFIANHPAEAVQHLQYLRYHLQSPPNEMALHHNAENYKIFVQKNLDYDITNKVSSKLQNRNNSVAQIVRFVPENLNNILEAQKDAKNLDCVFVGDKALGDRLENLTKNKKTSKISFIYYGDPKKVNSNSSQKVLNTKSSKQINTYLFNLPENRYQAAKKLNRPKVNVFYLNKNEANPEIAKEVKSVADSTTSVSAYPIKSYKEISRIAPSGIVVAPKEDIPACLATFSDLNRINGAQNDYRVISVSDSIDDSLKDRNQNVLFNTKAPGEVKNFLLNAFSPSTARLDKAPPDPIKLRKMDDSFKLEPEGIVKSKVTLPDELFMKVFPFQPKVRPEKQPTKLAKPPIHAAMKVESKDQLPPPIAIPSKELPQGLLDSKPVLGDIEPAKANLPTPPPINLKMVRQLLNSMKNESQRRILNLQLDSPPLMRVPPSQPDIQDKQNMIRPVPAMKLDQMKSITDSMTPKLAIYYTNNQELTDVTNMLERNLDPKQFAVTKIPLRSQHEIQELARFGSLQLSGYDKILLLLTPKAKNVAPALQDLKAKLDKRLEYVIFDDDYNRVDAKIKQCLGKNTFKTKSVQQVVSNQHPRLESAKGVRVFCPALLLGEYEHLEKQWVKVIPYQDHQKQVEPLLHQQGWFNIVVTSKDLYGELKMYPKSSPSCALVVDSQRDRNNRKDSSGVPQTVTQYETILNRLYKYCLYYGPNSQQFLKSKLEPMQPSRNPQETKVLFYQQQGEQVAFSDQYRQYEKIQYDNHITLSGLLLGRFKHYPNQLLQTKPVKQLVPLRPKVYMENENYMKEYKNNFIEKGYLNEDSGVIVGARVDHPYSDLQEVYYRDMPQLAGMLASQDAPSVVLVNAGNNKTEGVINKFKSKHIFRSLTDHSDEWITKNGQLANLSATQTRRRKKQKQFKQMYPDTMSGQYSDSQFYYLSSLPAVQGQRQPQPANKASITQRVADLKNKRTLLTLFVEQTDMRHIPQLVQTEANRPNSKVRVVEVGSRFTDRDRPLHIKFNEIDRIIRHIRTNIGNMGTMRYNLDANGRQVGVDGGKYNVVETVNYNQNNGYSNNNINNNINNINNTNITNGRPKIETVSYNVDTNITTTTTTNTNNRQKVQPYLTDQALYEVSNEMRDVKQLSSYRVSSMSPISATPINQTNNRQLYNGSTNNTTTIQNVVNYPLVREQNRTSTVVRNVQYPPSLNERREVYYRDGNGNRVDNYNNGDTNNTYNNNNSNNSIQRVTYISPPHTTINSPVTTNNNINNDGRIISGLPVYSVQQLDKLMSGSTALNNNYQQQQLMKNSLTFVQGLQSIVEGGMVGGQGGMVGGTVGQGGQGGQGRLSNIISQTTNGSRTSILNNQINRVSSINNHNLNDRNRNSVTTKLSQGRQIAQFNNYNQPGLLIQSHSGDQQDINVRQNSPVGTMNTQINHMGQYTAYDPNLKTNHINGANIQNGYNGGDNANPNKKTRMNSNVAQFMAKVNQFIEGTNFQLEISESMRDQMTIGKVYAEKINYFKGVPPVNSSSPDLARLIITDQRALEIVKIARRVPDALIIFFSAETLNIFFPPNVLILPKSQVATLLSRLQTGGDKDYQDQISRNHDDPHAGDKDSYDRSHPEFLGDGEVRVLYSPNIAQKLKNKLLAASMKNNKIIPTLTRNPQQILSYLKKSNYVALILQQNQIPQLPQGLPQNKYKVVPVPRKNMKFMIPKAFQYGNRLSVIFENQETNFDRQVSHYTTDKVDRQLKSIQNNYLRRTQQPGAQSVDSLDTEVSNKLKVHSVINQIGSNMLADQVQRIKKRLNGTSVELIVHNSKLAEALQIAKKCTVRLQSYIHALNLSYEIVQRDPANTCAIIVLIDMSMLPDVPQMKAANQSVMFVVETSKKVAQISEQFREDISGTVPRLIDLQPFILDIVEINDKLRVPQNSRQKSINLQSKSIINTSVDERFSNGLNNQRYPRVFLFYKEPDNIEIYNQLKNVAKNITFVPYRTPTRLKEKFENYNSYTGVIIANGKDIQEIQDAVSRSITQILYVIRFRPDPRMRKNDRVKELLTTESSEDLVEFILKRYERTKLSSPSQPDHIRDLREQKVYTQRYKPSTFGTTPRFIGQNFVPQANGSTTSVRRSYRSHENGSNRYIEEQVQSRYVSPQQASRR